MANVVVLGGNTQLRGERNSVTATGWVNAMVTGGTAIPSSAQGEFCHIIAMKNATLTLGIWGYESTLGNWVRADTVTFSLSNACESAPLRVLPSFSRVQATVDSIGASGSANIFWAFVGE